MYSNLCCLSLSLVSLNSYLQSNQKLPNQIQSLSNPNSNISKQYMLEMEDGLLQLKEGGKVVNVFLDLVKEDNQFCNAFGGPNVFGNDENCGELYTACLAADGHDHKECKKLFKIMIICHDWIIYY